MTWKRWNVGYETCVQTNTLIGGISEAGLVPAQMLKKRKRHSVLSAMPF